MAITYKFSSVEEANKFGNPVVTVENDEVRAEFFSGLVVDLYERVIEEVTYYHAIVFIADENLVIDAEYASSKNGGGVAVADASEDLKDAYKAALASQDVDLVRSYPYIA